MPSDQGDVSWFSNLLNFLPVRAVATGCKTFLFGGDPDPSADRLASARSLGRIPSQSSSNCLICTSRSSRSPLRWPTSCPENSVHLLTESSSTGGTVDHVDEQEPLVRSILRESKFGKTETCWKDPADTGPKPSVTFHDALNIETTISACHSECNHFFDLPSLRERRTLRRIAEAVLRRSGRLQTTTLAVAAPRAEGKVMVTNRKFPPKVSSPQMTLRGSGSSKITEPSPSKKPSIKPQRKVDPVSVKKTSSLPKKYAACYRKYPYLEFDPAAYKEYCKTPVALSQLPTSKKISRPSTLKGAMGKVVSWFRRRLPESEPSEPSGTTKSRGVTSNPSGTTSQLALRAKSVSKSRCPSAQPQTLPTPMPKAQKPTSSRFKPEDKRRAGTFPSDSSKRRKPSKSRSRRINP